jgi:hypothetical protein
MDNVIVLAIIGVTAFLFIYLFWGAVKRLLVNSVVGIVLIVLLNLVFGLGIELNELTVAAVALFGLPAVGTLLILHIGGMLVFPPK